MSLFPVVDVDEVAQVGDRVRILADKSFKNQNETAYSAIEIKPEASASFINVTGDLTKPEPHKKWYLDYAYDTAGTKTISLKITTSGLSPSIVTVTRDISIVTAATDNLFSTDHQLKQIQEDIYKLLPEGRSSFKYKHRAAQKFILDWLWNNGYAKTSTTGELTRFTAADIINTEFISDWSAYVVLRMLFYSSSNVPDDIFSKKAEMFLNNEERAREKVILRLDTDSNSTLESGEGIQVASRRLIRV